MYRCIVADPPWSYGAPLKMKDGVKRSAASQYKTMSLDEISGFLRHAHIKLEDSCHLWLWVTNPFLVDGSANRIVNSWGFTPKALCTWVKGRHTPEKLVLNIGMGAYLRGATEHLMFCVRGRNAAKMVQSHSIPNVFVAPRGAHSAKPDEAYDIIQQISPGPRLALFERKHRDGFECRGDELCSAIPSL